MHPMEKIWAASPMNSAGTDCIDNSAAPTMAHTAPKA